MDRKVWMEGLVPSMPWDKTGAVEIPVHEAALLASRIVLVPVCLWVLAQEDIVIMDGGGLKSCSRPSAQW